MEKAPVAIVTGAAGGLGKAFSETLLKRGFQVCMSDVDRTRGQETASEFQAKYGAANVLFIVCDTTSQENMEEMFKRVARHFGGIDLVVNNAGIMSETQWQKMLQVNVNGVIHGTMVGFEHLRTDQGGRGGQIINVSSSAGLYPSPWCASYSASKHAAMAYTISCARHPMYKKLGVRMNVLCPFFVATPMLNITEQNMYPHQISLAKQTLKAVGVMGVSQVLAAFETLLDEKKNGAVIEVSPKGHRQIKMLTPDLGELSAKSQL